MRGVPGNSIKDFHYPRRPLKAMLLRFAGATGCLVVDRLRRMPVVLPTCQFANDQFTNFDVRRW